jgi:hypothetical protein
MLIYRDFLFLSKQYSRPNSLLFILELKEVLNLSLFKTLKQLFFVVLNWAADILIWLVWIFMAVGSVLLLLVLLPFKNTREKAKERLEKFFFSDK